MEAAMASPSLAHTYGNVTSFVTEFIKGLFPKNYFKTVNISTAIAYKQFNVLKDGEKNYLKRNKPVLVVRPRIDINDNDTFLNGTYLTTRINDLYMEHGFSNLQPFVQDKENQIEFKYLLNRLKMYFDITIILSTQMEQINIAHYLKNVVRQERPFDLEVALEGNIPRPMIEMYSQEVGVPIYNEEGSVKNFLDKLNSVSHYPITYKMKTSTGNEEFFRYYPAKIDTTLYGLNMDDGNKKNQVDDAFTIQFSISTEFNSAGLYYYITTKIDSIKELNKKIVENQGEENELKPLFTVTNLFDIKLPEGWSQYTSCMFKVETEEKPDGMNISHLYNNSLRTFIKYHNENGIPIDPFINSVLLMDNTQLEPNVDYTIDFLTGEVVVNKLSIDATYRLIIIFNSTYVNNTVKSLYNLE